MPHSIDKAELEAIYWMSQKAIKERIAIERELGMRSFKHFFRMAWKMMDAAPFIDNWHIDLVCETMQSIAMRETGDTVICVPPRSAKSLMTSVAFVAWVWTWWPSCKFITASYDQRLASRDALKCRRLVESPWYQARWGDKVQMVKDQNQKLYYQTSAGGHRWTSSPAMGVTGEGADFVLFDDPHSTQKAESAAERLAVELFWFEGVPSRMNNPKAGRKLVIQQRVNEKDLAGQCIERGYNHVVLPALFEHDHPQRHPRDPRKVDGEPLWPARFDKGDYEKLMKEIGSYAAAGQYQQRPAPREGGMFNRDWFVVADTAPADLVLVRRWDFAASEQAYGSDPDYTVGVLMGKSRSTGKFYILDIQRIRKSFQGVELKVKATAQSDGKKVRVVFPLDPGSAGKGLVEYLTSQMAGYMISSERETGSKVTRAQPLASQAEAGNVVMVKKPFALDNKDHNNDWIRIFLDEAGNFPMGGHDDQVDAASGAFRALLDSTTGFLEYYSEQDKEILALKPEPVAFEVTKGENPWHGLNE